MSQLAQAKYPRVLKVSLPKTNNLPLVNSRCHYNAVQAVKTGLAVGVVRHVPPSEYETINQSLMKLKKALVDPLPWHLKLIVLDPNNWC